MNIQSMTGQTLGQYELREILGFGGMGVTYKGYQKNLEREVAVKVLSPGLANETGYIERFYREAKTAASLEHTHIVPVYDHGVQGDISYVVMRLLPGGSLEQRIKQQVEREHPLPSLGEVSTLLTQLANALDYAHGQGVIHRDIKPANIMFDGQGNAFLVDFGIAKLLESTTSFTASGVPMGTPLFMPPEQWRSESLTPAADQYALAVTIYALMTGGRLPFEATTPYGMMHKHINEDPTPPQEYRADVPRAVAGVLDRAMSKNPENRYPSMGVFAQDFADSVGGFSGETTNFFTTPVRKQTSSVIQVPMGPAGDAPPVTVTITKPIYRLPVFWVMSAALALVVVALIVLLLGGGSDGNGDTSDGAAGDGDGAGQEVAGAGDGEEVIVPGVAADDETATAVALTALYMAPFETATAEMAAVTLTASYVSAMVTAMAEAESQAVTAEAEALAAREAVTAVQETSEARVAARTSTRQAANEQAAVAVEQTASAQQTLDAEATAAVERQTATADARTATAEARTATAVFRQTATAEARTATAEAEMLAASQTANAPTPTLPPTPTPEPNVRLYYDIEGEFLLVNISDEPLDVSRLAFVQAVPDGPERRWDRDSWFELTNPPPPDALANLARLDPDRCMQILAGSAFQPLDQGRCGRVVIFGSSVRGDYHFWIADRPGATSFDVRDAESNEVYHTCRISDGICEFYLPS
ncbi:MAG: serine/threonine protein kinase [Chloroflexi bacterium]|nr:serine/threonine protein kinase [Chloroflexota bacterium]